MKITVLFFIFGIVAVILPAGLIRYAKKTGLLAIPNQRSSHQIPTPVGGGLSFVILFWLLLLLGYSQDFFSGKLLILFGSSLLIALVGFLDDRASLLPRFRFLAHLLAAFWVLACIQFPALSWLGWRIPWIYLNYVIGVLYLVWLLNLYNFMDGIDGIASIEALSVIAGILLIAWPLLHEYVWLLVGLFICVSGFLYWNWSPAKLFMGDVGSGFLGWVLGIFSLLTSTDEPDLLWVWGILLGVFIVDASYTLSVRFFRKEPVWQAHRSHAYQKAARLCGSHRTVTLAVMLINLVWLWPWAWWTRLHLDYGLVWAILAYIPLIALAYYYRAGLPDSNNLLNKNE